MPDSLLKETLAAVASVRESEYTVAAGNTTCTNVVRVTLGELLHDEKVGIRA